MKETVTLTPHDVMDAYHDLRDIRVACSGATSSILRLLSGITHGQGCTLSIEEIDEDEEDF